MNIFILNIKKLNYQYFLSYSLVIFLITNIVLKVSKDILMLGWLFAYYIKINNYIERKPHIEK